MAAISSSAEAEAAGRCEPSAGRGEPPRRVAAPRPPSTQRASSAGTIATEHMSILRQCEDRTPRGDAAQIVLTQRDQFCVRLRCDRAPDQHAAARRPAPPLEPAYPGV